MSDQGTGVSSVYDGELGLEGDARDGTSPGLVLLYAPNFTQFEPAYPLRTPQLTLGRDLACDVCVPEQAVSRQHARIESQAGRWTLRDLGSRNGTVVGGALVREVTLEDGAEIRIGDAIFKFVAAGAEQYARHRIDGHVRGERRTQTLHTELIGGAQMDRIGAELERVACTELSAMILGETGTGKEVAARALHRHSGRKGLFQAINCAAIPQNLLESELFGYRRGAFSGADRDKPGLIRLAHAGTLFLDEIGDMPLDAQAKLLRVLQSREVFPLGASVAEPVDLRVVCATHRDLDAHVQDGRFRGDLFARLNEHAVRLPPLAARKEDLYLLACTFARRYGAAQNFAFPFMTALLHYNWPFNVRELESCMKRAAALSAGAALDRQHLPDAIRLHMRSYDERTAAAAPASARASAPPGAVAREQAFDLLPLRNVPPSFRVTAPPAPVAALAAARSGTESAPASGVADEGSAQARGYAPSEAALRDALQRHAGNLAAVGREFGRERMQVHRWLRRYEIDPEAFR